MKLCWKNKKIEKKNRFRKELAIVQSVFVRQYINLNSHLQQAEEKNPNCLQFAEEMKYLKDASL